MNVKITVIKNRVGYIKKEFMTFEQIYNYIKSKKLRKMGKRYVGNDGKDYLQLELVGGK